jgi:hypothetical protein
MKTRGNMEEEWAESISSRRTCQDISSCPVAKRIREKYGTKTYYL